MATLLKVLNNLSDIRSAGGVALHVRTQGGLFFTSDDFGIDGPYEKFSEAAEAVNLLTVTPTTEEIWVDDSLKSDSETEDDDDDEHSVQRRLAN